MKIVIYDLRILPLRPFCIVANTQSTGEPRNENHASSIPIRQTSESQDNMSDLNQEFVSEDYDASPINEDEIRREFEQLSSAKKGPGEIYLIPFFLLLYEIFF